MNKIPAVKNELILEDVLSLYGEDEGQSLRAVVLYSGLLEMTIYQPKEKEQKLISLLFAPDQMEQLIQLWQEWKNEEEDLREKE